MRPPEVILSSAGRGWNTLDAAFVHIPAGRVQAPEGERHVLGLHFGRPVRANCSVGGVRMRGLQKPGDIGFVPAGVAGSWEDDADCHILRLGLRPALLEQVVEELGRDVAKIDLIPRPQFRDARIEAIGWAIRADLEADVPSDTLYVDSLASALAVRVIEIATDVKWQADGCDAGMPARQLRMLIEFIDAHLDKKLHLADLAKVAGLSVTRLKTLFRNSTGKPVHQYVIQRRAEYARALIANTTMPASQVALAAGFAHQGHMAATMRRILGQYPSEIARPRMQI